MWFPRENIAGLQDVELGLFQCGVGVGFSVRVSLLSGWKGFMGGWFLKGRQR